MKSFAGDAGDDLGIDSSPWPAFADAKEMTCPGHRLQNGLGIEWLDCSQINDLDIDSFFFELASRCHGIVQNGRISDHREILSGTAAYGFACGKRNFFRKPLCLDPVVEEFVSAEQDRVIKGD